MVVGCGVNAVGTDDANVDWMGAEDVTGCGLAGAVGTGFGVGACGIGAWVCGIPGT